MFNSIIGLMVIGVLLIYLAKDENKVEAGMFLYKIQEFFKDLFRKK